MARVNKVKTQDYSIEFKYRNFVSWIPSCVQDGEFGAKVGNAQNQ